MWKGREEEVEERKGGRGRVDEPFLGRDDFDDSRSSTPVVHFGHVALVKAES